MTDQIIVLTALNSAAMIIGDYLRPGHPRDPASTIKRLTEVLDDEELADAIRRVEEVYGFSYPMF